MLYVIIGEDSHNSMPKRLANRPAHLERLQALKAQGRLILAGPMPAIDAEDPGPAGFTGSVIIAEFGSLTEAEAWANDDPYLISGVYTKVKVRPFKKVLP